MTTEGRSATRTRHPSARRQGPGSRSARPHGGQGAGGRAKGAGAGKGPAPDQERETSGQVLLVATVAVLCLIGLVMVLSASSVQALREYGSSWLYFRRQVMWVLLGAIALTAFSRVDYRKLRRFGSALLGLSLVLLVLVLMPGLGITAGGSTRWLGFGSWRMQPSELAKLGLLLFCADVLTRRPAWSSGQGSSALRPVLIASGAVAVLVLAQPDLGTTLVAGCVVMCLLYVGGTRLKTMAGLVVAAVGGAFVLGMAEPYRRERMLSFLNPWADADNTGYQVVQSLVGLGTGRFTGVGVGASRAKWGFLPNAHTDFIFAITGEELGMLGSLLVLGLFITFAVLGIRASLRAPDRYGMLLAAGITAWVTGQAFINIGAVVGVLPVSGVPLPFVSFGGSSLVLLMGAVGVLVNVAGQGRGGRRPQPTKAVPGRAARGGRPPASRR